MAKKKNSKKKAPPKKKEMPILKLLRKFGKAAPLPEEPEEVEEEDFEPPKKELPITKLLRKLKKTPAAGEAGEEFGDAPDEPSYSESGMVFTYGQTSWRTQHTHEQLKAESSKKDKGQTIAIECNLRGQRYRTECKLYG